MPRMIRASRSSAVTAVAIAALGAASLLALRPDGDRAAAAGPSASSGSHALTGPGPAPQQACQVEADKVAKPSVVTLGEQVEITLTLDGRCPGEPGTGRADIVLAIDRSASQVDNGTWLPTIAAANAFAELIDYERHQVALVTFSGDVFSSRAVLRQQLTGDGAAIEAALAAIPEPPPFTLSTNLTDAVNVSQAELESDRARDDAQPVIVLLSDGDHNDLFAGDPIAAAQEAKDAGTLIITIGLGVDDQATSTLRQMASREALHFPSPTADDLQAVYAEVAGTVEGTGRITLAEIIDMLPPEVAYVPGSASPQPDVVTASQLRWSLPELPVSGWTATYRVTPLIVGTYATNKVAYADYLDADASVASATFPQPVITVREPGQFTSSVFVPAVYKRYCRPGKPFDVALVLDTSSSMWGDPLEQTRLAARSFLRLLAMPPSRVAVIGFNERPSVVAGLTADRAFAEAALDQLPLDEGSRIDLAVREAARVLESGTGEGHVPVIILLTDGKQVGGTNQDVLDAGDDARRAGVVIYTIGIGGDVDPILLTQLAGSPSRFYLAPNTDDLVRIYTEIAGTLPCDFPD